MRPLPLDCPSCGHRLAVKRLVCRACGTEVEGLYQLPTLASLGRADQEFAAQFLKASGSLKEMARVLGVSYPTVRNRLDEIIGKLTEIEAQQEAGETPALPERQQEAGETPLDSARGRPALPGAAE